MADPVTFAQARLDEDETAATAADSEWGALATSGGDHSLTVAQTRHIKLHNPMRTLREVEAGRRILERHTACAERGNGPCWEFPIADGLLCRELADLLYRWADHPDYDPDWTPHG